MSPNDTRLAKELFLEALDLADEERARFVQRLRAERPELAARVARLLGAHGAADALPRVLDAAKTSVLRTIERTEGRAGTVLGDYELIEEAASGASGVVYRARQLSLDRIVAVKVLRAGRFAGAREVERFRAEAEVVARLDDPHVVPVHEIGETDDGHYFSMKWIEGGSLAERAADFRAPRDAARLVLRIARAVHHAHQRGVLHRDLKPSNVLLDAAGTPYVVDFGVAKRIDEADPSGTAWIAGTPAYMAPEQTTKGGDLSVATDVWALGCILSELLTGTRAFDGDSVTDVLLRVREADPALLPNGIPRDLRTIVATCLAKDPARRYPSANALALDLERWLEHEPILARPTSTPERLVLWARRRPLVASLAGAVALLVVALAVTATWASVQLREHLARALDAEAAANERLRAALVAQARDRRHDDRAGHRGRGLELLAQAAAIEPGADVRDEVIACLALPDATLEREWQRVDQAAAAAFDAELALFADANRAGDVTVRRVADDSVVRRLPSPGTSAWVARFSPDGRRLAVKYHDASSNANARVVLWDVGSGAALAQLDVLADGLELRPDGSLVVIARSGELIEIDLETGALRRRADFGRGLLCCRFDPSGERLAIGRFPDVALEVLSWPALEPLLVLEGEPTIFDVDWTRDGASLVVGRADASATLVDPATGAVQRSFVGHRADVVDVEVSPAAELLATRAWDGTTRVWSLATGEMVVRMEARLIGFGRDGRLACSTNERYGLWRLDEGLVMRALHGHFAKAPQEIAFSRDGALLASAGGDEVCLWDARTGARLARLDLVGAEAALFHPDGRLITVDDEVGIRAWPLPLDPDAEPETLLAVPARWAVVTPDGRSLAYVASGRVGVLALDGSAPPRELDAYRGVHWCAVDPSGRWLAAGNWHGVDERARVWDLASGEVAARLWPEAGAVRPAFAADGELLVLGSGSRYRIFRTGTWEELEPIERAIELAAGSATCAAGPGGVAALLGRAGVVELVDLATRERIARFESPGGAGDGALALDPSGRFLAATSLAQRVELWDLERTRDELARLGLAGSARWPFE